MIALQEFERLFPDFKLDFSKPISEQQRVYAQSMLDDLPVEIVPGAEYRSGGRGRPNRNQTRTHSQCATCHRVLRNDHFYTPPSMVRKNVIYSHCIECSQKHNSHQYEQMSNTIRNRTDLVWSYLTPYCVLCGFKQHSSAMDLHYVESARAGYETVSNINEKHVTELITTFAAKPNATNGEKLIRHSKTCIPVCSNCHRMLHANVLRLPSPLTRIEYRLDTLVQLIHQMSQ